MTARIGWVDTSSGVSGDMLLGALTALGAVDVEDVVRRLQVEASVDVGTVTRHGLAATAVHVKAGPAQPLRRLADIVAVIDRADLDGGVRARATATFHRLAVAEASVHGIDVDEVHFHEVGAVDTIVDVVGACTGVAALGLSSLVVAPIALGGGHVRTAHGHLPVPGPAVLALLRDTQLMATGGPVDVELATPTGVAVLAELGTSVGAMPAMRVRDVGTGAGDHEVDDVANVLRIVVGEAADPDPDTAWQVLACNVDDLDPRLWPVVLDRLLVAGAADAWLTPIVMKKGRPAHTLSVLVGDTDVAGVEQVMFTETSTIGVRTTRVGKHALEREWLEVDVAGETVRVKVARHGGVVTNVAPEFDDVVRAAGAISRPVKWVLAAATAAAHETLS